MISKKEQKLDIFIPYYINQSRLLDIYAIINGGYSEYSEITSTINTENNKKTNGSLKGGFKVFNFGTEVAGEKADSQIKTDASSEKKIQTITSVLSIVKESLTKNGYISEINDSKPGQFICMPVVFNINSVKSFIDEMQDIMRFLNGLKKYGFTVEESLDEVNKFNDVIKAFKIMFEDEELLYDTTEYAIIGSISDVHLYQSLRSDIIGTELKCLAQIKRVYKEGTQLLKNTVFTKVKQLKEKKELIDKLKDLCDGDFYDFESVVVPSIEGKPVYQIEIIALFQ